MTDQTTETRVAEIEARADKALSGPWYEGTRSPNYPDGSEGPIVGHKYSSPICYFDRAGDKAGDVANAAFIAHARTDIPWLLSQLRAAWKREAAIAKLVSKESVKMHTLNGIIASIRAALQETPR